MNLTLPQQQLKTTQPDSYQKGLRFETYIKELFNERYFKLHKWRKAEKLPGSKFSFDISHPDLEMIFGRGKYRFAVECKWRKKFNDGKITWASNCQICSYEDFENQERIPVFVAIGIGGEPDNPEKLFITPLRNICSSEEVYEQNLIPFSRKPTHKFYYDTIQLKLF